MLAFVLAATVAVCAHHPRHPDPPGSDPGGLVLPALFSDGMVLQRDAPVRVWGRALPGETVVVSIAGQEVATRAASDGSWPATLASIAAGGPHVLRVEGGGAGSASPEARVIDDVLVGEVWLGAGQSNMVMTLRHCDNAAPALEGAGRPRLRLFTESSAPTDDAGNTAPGKGCWVACTPETAADFSGVLYAFGARCRTSSMSPSG